MQPIKKAQPVPASPRQQNQCQQQLERLTVNLSILEKVSQELAEKLTPIRLIGCEGPAEEAQCEPSLAAIPAVIRTLSDKIERINKNIQTVIEEVQC